MTQDVFLLLGVTIILEVQHSVSTIYDIYE